MSPARSSQSIHRWNSTGAITPPVPATPPLFQ
jgi:hypothetical protein